MIIFLNAFLPQSFVGRLCMRRLVDVRLEDARRHGFRPSALETEDLFSFSRMMRRSRPRIFAK